MPHRAFDQVKVRCPQLGGEVTFHYCRTVLDGLPCHRALVCFELHFPVEPYFRLALKPETFQRIFLEEKPGRMGQLLSAIQRARKQD